jgi:Holliday junction resolvasome RuvABC endonuclease subunit
MGIDPGFGSSAFGVVVTQISDKQIQILEAEAIDCMGFASKVWYDYRQDLYRWC